MPGLYLDIVKTEETLEDVSFQRKRLRFNERRRNSNFFFLLCRETVGSALGKKEKRNEKKGEEKKTQSRGNYLGWLKTKEREKRETGREKGRRDEGKWSVALRRNLP